MSHSGPSSLERANFSNILKNLALRMASLRLLLAVLISCCCCWRLSTASKVLFIAPLGTKSHMQFFGEIATVLADNGHQITFISSYGMKKHSNITEIDVKLPMDKYMPNNFQYPFWQTSLQLFSLVPKLCVEALGREEVQKLNVEDFDLVFISAFMDDCFYSLFDDTKIPFIMMNPNMMVTYLHDLIGNFDFPSFVPMMGLSSTYPLSFTDRIGNALGTQISNIITNLLYVPWITDECKASGLCKKDMTSIMDIASKASLIFINSVQSLEIPARPYVPAVIHAGGLNCHPAQPLPRDLESFIQGSGEAGIIYMSLGSAVKPSDMEEKSRQILVKVFGSLPQRVLWKWDQESMEDLPSNVKLSKWLPQQDILGHSKLKLFISHGGLFSTLESIFHAVPVLGMPVFADQSTNIARVVAEGFGRVVHWEDLSEDLLNGTIQELLTNKKYRETVQSRSVLMRDSPLSPQQTVLYWSEYVIRHKGAPHLRSPIIDMPWYKVLNVDVWFVLIATVAAILSLVVLLFKCLACFLFKKCFRKQRSVGSDRTKKQKKN